MKTIYVDTSVIAGILLENPGHEKYQNSIQNEDRIVSSALLEAELCSVAAREKISPKELEKFLIGIELIHTTRSLLKEYRRILTSGYVKGADAFHIATALYLDPELKELKFLTADSRQKEVIKKLKR